MRNNVLFSCCRHAHWPILPACHQEDPPWSICSYYPQEISFCAPNVLPANGDSSVQNLSALQVVGSTWTPIATLSIIILSPLPPAPSTPSLFCQKSHIFGCLKRTYYNFPWSPLIWSHLWMFGAILQLPIRMLLASCHCTSSTSSHSVSKPPQHCLVLCSYFFTSSQYHCHHPNCLPLIRFAQSFCIFCVLFLHFFLLLSFLFLFTSPWLPLHFGLLAKFIGPKHPLSAQLWYQGSGGCPVYGTFIFYYLYLYFKVP